MAGTQKVNGKGKVSNGRNGNTWVFPTIVGGAVAFLQIFWSVAYTGLVQNQNRVEEQLRQRIEIIERGFLRIREHEEFTKRLDSQLAKMDSRIVILASRDEVDARLLTNSNALQQYRTELDGLKRDFGQTYSVKDALATIQGRLERIEAWSRMPINPSVR